MFIRDWSGFLLLATAVMPTLESLTTLHHDPLTYKRRDIRWAASIPTLRARKKNFQDIIYSIISEMEGQGNILKTLLIAAAVYTLTVGAPVKRDTSGNTVIEMSGNTVIEICAAAKRVRMNLPMCKTTNWTKLYDEGDSYNEGSVAAALPQKLKDHSFNGAVREAVWKCFNNSDCDPQKCKLAASAIILQDSTTNFIAAHGDSATAQTSCNTPTNSSTDESMEQILCNASVYITDLLQHAVNGKYYDSCSA